MTPTERKSLQGAIIDLTRRGHFIIREADQLLKLLGYDGPSPWDADPAALRPVKRPARQRNDYVHATNRSE